MKFFKWFCIFLGVHVSSDIGQIGPYMGIVEVGRERIVRGGSDDYNNFHSSLNQVQ